MGTSVGPHLAHNKTNRRSLDEADTDLDHAYLIAGDGTATALHGPGRFSSWY